MKKLLMAGIVGVALAVCMTGCGSCPGWCPFSSAKTDCSCCAKGEECKCVKDDKGVCSCCKDKTACKCKCCKPTAAPASAAAPATTAAPAK